MALRQSKDNTISFLLSTPALYKENQKLRSENNALKLKLKTITDQTDDDSQIEIINPSWRIQAIRLVSIDSHLVFTSSNFENIKPGQPVASGNSLVGLVTSVSPPIIKVSPLNQEGIKLRAQLETGDLGIYTYKSNQAFIINLESNIAFNPSTIVITTADEMIPENLVIGQVDQVTSTQANPTKEASLILNERISAGNSFYVITKVN